MLFPTRDSLTTRRHRRYIMQKQHSLKISFFFLLSLFLVTLTFYNSFYRISTSPQNYSPWVIAHALSLSLWVIVLVLQPFLIWSVNYKLHKQIGFLSIGLVLLVIVSTVFSALETFKVLPPSWSAEKKYAVLCSQLYGMVVFALLYTAALLKAKVFTVHVQCITASLIVILGPVIFRTTITFGLSVSGSRELAANLFTYGLLNLFLIALCGIHRRKNESYAPYLLTVAALLPLELTQVCFSV